MSKISYEIFNFKDFIGIFLIKTICYDNRYKSIEINLHGYLTLERKMG